MFWKCFVFWKNLHAFSTSPYIGLFSRVLHSKIESFFILCLPLYNLSTSSYCLPLHMLNTVNEKWHQWIWKLRQGYAIRFFQFPSKPLTVITHNSQSKNLTVLRTICKLYGFSAWLLVSDFQKKLPQWKYFPAEEFRRMLNIISVD